MLPCGYRSENDFLHQVLRKESRPRQQRAHGYAQHLGHLEADATGRDRVWICGWLSVGYRVSGASRPGRVGHSDPQWPSTGSIWRPISRTTWGVDFCPLGIYRAVGVDLELSNREEGYPEVRLVVLVPQHQAAVYETYNKKGYRHLTARHVIS
jgi:hypothetical protein